MLGLPCRASTILLHTITRFTQIVVQSSEEQRNTLYGFRRYQALFCNDNRVYRTRRQIRCISVSSKFGVRCTRTKVIHEAVCNLTTYRNAKINYNKREFVHRNKFISHKNTKVCLSRVKM